MLCVGKYEIHYERDQRRKDMSREINARAAYMAIQFIYENEQRNTVERR